MNGTFTPHYKNTIGVDFGLKVIKWSPDKFVRLQFWDLSGRKGGREGREGERGKQREAEKETIRKSALTSSFSLCLPSSLPPSFLGQERFNSMSRVYFKEAVGAFVVFDVTDSKTLEMAVHWKKDIDLKVKVGGDTQNIPVVLLANKVGWVGLGWVGLGWVGLGWVGLELVGLDWVGLGWNWLGWIGLGWVGLGWVGLGWVGLDWVGLDGLIGWVWFRCTLKKYFN